MRRLLALLGIFVLVGCGPEKSNVELERREMDELYMKSKVALDALEGTYRGYINFASDLPKDRVLFELNLRSFSTFVPSPGRVEIIEIPNMIGFMTPVGNVDISMFFTQGTYDSRSATLKMFSERGVGAVSFNFLEVRPIGNRLVGEFWNNKVRRPVDFERRD